MKYSKSNNNAFNNGLNQAVDQYFIESNLKKQANFAFFVKAILLLAMYFSLYAGIYLFELSLSQLALLYALMGPISVMVFFSIVHDASHNALFKNRKHNNLARYIGDLIGLNTYVWNIRHNIQHHTFTNVLGGDIIIEKLPLIRFSPHQPYRNFHRYQLYYLPLLYMLYSFFIVFVIDIKLFFSKDICNLKNIKHPNSEWAKMIGFKVLYIFNFIVLPALLTPFSIGQIIGLFFLMHFTSGIFLSTIAALGHFVEGPTFPEPVNDLIDNDWTKHEIETSTDFSPHSKFTNWISGGLNTHVAHHLFPRICHVHYRKITPIIEKHCLEHGYRYHKESFKDAVASHIRFVKKMSRP